MAQRQQSREDAFLAIFLAALGVIIGVLTLALGLAVDVAEALFLAHPHLVWLLPVAGIASHGIYHVLHLDFSWSTARVLKASKSDGRVPLALVPAIIVGTFLTVLCGGSVGKEAAAIQMGGGLTSLFREKVAERYRRLLAPAATAAALGAMLGAPLAGVVFSFEAVRKRPSKFVEVVAPLFTSLLSWGVTMIVGVRFLELPSVSVLELVDYRIIGIALASAVGAGALAVVFCKAFEAMKGGLRRVGSPVFALAVGGVVTALVLGYADPLHYEPIRDYCGTGMTLVDGALSGNRLPSWAFLAKLALTLLTFAGGYKGGELMPILAIGACLGSSIDWAFVVAGGGVLSGGAPVVEMSMMAFFAACTNCPLTAMVLSFELFGSVGLIASALPVIVASLISCSSSIYPTTLTG